MGTAYAYLKGPVRPKCFSLKAYGNNEQGQVGNSGDPFRGADFIVTAAAGVNHSLAVTSKGEVFVWGCNLFGQLGNRSINPEKNREMITPAMLISIESKVGIRKVAAGYGHSAALTETGLVFTWGLGTDGQLGYELFHSDAYVIPFTQERCQLTPRSVSLTEAINDIACGKNFTMLLTVSGSPLVCGSGVWGVLGNGRLSQQFLPGPVTGELIEKRVSRIASGWSHCLAYVPGEGVYTWGQPYLDIDTEQPALCYPELVVRTDCEVLSLACGQNHSAVAIQTPGVGSVCTWGSNGYGQLGYDSEQSLVLEPRIVNTGGNWKVEAVACGWNFTVALGRNGQVKGWGGNKYRQFGAIEDSATPKLLDMTNVTEVACGYSHLLLLQTPASKSNSVTQGSPNKDDYSAS